MSADPVTALTSIRTSCSSLVTTRAPQKRHGPEPSCAQTTRPQATQLLTSSCFRAWHSHACRPGICDEPDDPSLRFTYFVFPFRPGSSLFGCNAATDSKSFLFFLPSPLPSSASSAFLRYTLAIPGGGGTFLPRPGKPIEYSMLLRESVKFFPDVSQVLFLTAELLPLLGELDEEVRVVPVRRVEHVAQVRLLLLARRQRQDVAARGNEFIILKFLYRMYRTMKLLFFLVSKIRNFISGASAAYSEISLVPSNLRTLLSSTSNHEESVWAGEDFILVQRIRC